MSKDRIEWNYVSSSVDGKQETNYNTWILIHSFNECHIQLTEYLNRISLPAFLTYPAILVTFVLYLIDEENKLEKKRYNNY